MEIVLGKTAGFCFGVNNAVKNVERLLEQKEKIYCLGNLVHNKPVINNLKEKGLEIVEDINEVSDKSNLVIRAHGVAKSIYKVAKEKNIKLYDLTCKRVLELHNLVEKYANSGYYIVLIGTKNHPENIGTISFAGEKNIILENKEEIDNVIEQVRKSGTTNLLIISQTTFSIDKFNDYTEEIKRKINFNLQIEIINTICNTLKQRQEETRKLASSSELMIIIGGKNSSNTLKLYNEAIQGCNNAMLVETKEDLYMNYIRRFDRIGVIAGASTSKESINEIMDVLRKG